MSRCHENDTNGNNGAWHINLIAILKEIEGRIRVLEEDHGPVELFEDSDLYPQFKDLDERIDKMTREELIEANRIIEVILRDKLYGTAVPEVDASTIFNRCLAWRFTAT